MASQDQPGHQEPRDLKDRRESRALMVLMELLDQL